MDQWRAISRPAVDDDDDDDDGMEQQTHRHRTLSSSATNRTHDLRYRLAIGSPLPSQCHTPAKYEQHRQDSSTDTLRLTHSGQTVPTTPPSAPPAAAHQHQQQHQQPHRHGRAERATHTCARPRTRVDSALSPFPLAPAAAPSTDRPISPLHPSPYGRTLPLTSFHREVRRACVLPVASASACPLCVCAICEENMSFEIYNAIESLRSVGDFYFLLFFSIGVYAMQIQRFSKHVCLTAGVVLFRRGGNDVGHPDAH
ncbi:hypothetical protein P5V15_002215 [Pogonomyrmex californicus]